MQLHFRTFFGKADSVSLACVVSREPEGVLLRLSGMFSRMRVRIFVNLNPR